MTAYDVIEAIEGEGVAMWVTHSARDGWKIQTKGTLGHDARLLIGAYRADIVHLLGVRNLARERRDCAELTDFMGPDADMERLGKWYAHSANYTGDNLRAFTAGWNQEDTK